MGPITPTKERGRNEGLSALSRREDLDNAIWADPDFEELSPSATLLYLWSFTNPRCNMAGLYKVSLRAMVESKVPANRLVATLEELAGAGFAYYHDSVLWVRSRVKHLRSRSPQMARSIANDVRKLPSDHQLRHRFLHSYGKCRWLREELSQIPDDPEFTDDLHTLSGTSPEVLGQRQGQGTGLRKGREAVGNDDLTRELFDYWRERCNHSQAKLTADRRAKIKARLGEGYTPDQIRRAIDGAARAPFINDGGHRFDDIELICRTGTKLEQFIGRAENVVPIAGRKENVSDWLREINAPSVDGDAEVVS